MRKSLTAFLMLTACGNLDQVGRSPEFAAMPNSPAQNGVYSTLPAASNARGSTEQSSLWTAQRSSLLGDHRASARGDILTVVVEIDDQATLNDSTGRSRTASDKVGMPSLFGIPQRLDAAVLPDGASSADLVSVNSASTFAGTGTVTRAEKVTLRLAATVVEELPNGVLRIAGQQQVRVNNEMRDLIVKGYVRPDDISRQNEITYDKIAEAQISYGGRGQITDVQQPGWGQQAVDAIIPF